MTSFNPVKNRISNRKYFFWYGHSLYWIAVLIQKIPLNLDLFESFELFLSLVSAVFMGFFITCILRFVYKKYSWYRFKLYYLVIIIFICNILITLIWLYAVMITDHLLTGYPLDMTYYSILRWTTNNYLIMFLWSCLYLGYKIWEESNNQKFQLEHERSLLKTAQLEMLRYQINPHFLFNTLNSARALVLVDPPQAREMLTQISEFLRYSLSEGKKSTIPLEKEMEAINNYLDIEKIRYKEKLIVEYNIDPKAKDFDIPVFLILPIVENAIKHGMKTTTLPLRIKLNAEVVNDFIQIDVVNSGSWIGDIKIDNNSTGTGLKNVQKRLENMYPDNFHFEIIKEDSFTHVVMKIKIEH
ncbi:MAG: hypothetical protein EHM44_02370 [Ignavibacteriales bacterium]|nr:MAG: hypothetical protein EHM44_02370 [Ignavibacteriales bacterium]